MKLSNFEYKFDLQSISSVLIKLLPSKFFRRDFKTQSDFRKTICVHLKSFIYNKTVMNTSTGIVIGFNKSGIEKCVSQIGDIKACAMCNLQIILSNAQLANESTDRKGREQILKILHFICKVDIDGTPYDIWIYVRQTPLGFFMYSVNVKA